MIGHTQECIDAHFAAKRAQEEWDALYPNYCRKCYGAGKTSYYQSVPYGMGSASFEVIDPCICSEEGFCPRCGEVHDTYDEYGEYTQPCPHCGWTDGDAVGEFRPPTPECFCDFLEWEER